MSQYSTVLSPIVVDAVLKVINPATATNVDLKDVRVMRKLGLVVTPTDGLQLSDDTVWHCVRVPGLVGLNSPVLLLLKACRCFLRVWYCYKVQLLSQFWEIQIMMLYYDKGVSPLCHCGFGRNTNYIAMLYPSVVWVLILIVFIIFGVVI